MLIVHSFNVFCSWFLNFFFQFTFLENDVCYRHKQCIVPLDLSLKFDDNYHFLGLSQNWFEDPLSMLFFDTSQIITVINRFQISAREIIFTAVNINKQHTHTNTTKNFIHTWAFWVRTSIWSCWQYWWWFGGIFNLCNTFTIDKNCTLIFSDWMKMAISNLNENKWKFSFFLVNDYFYINKLNILQWNFNNSNVWMKTWFMHKWRYSY